MVNASDILCEQMEAKLLKEQREAVEKNNAEETVETIPENENKTETVFYLTNLKIMSCLDY